MMFKVCPVLGVFDGWNLEKCSEWGEGMGNIVYPVFSKEQEWTTIPRKYICILKIRGCSKTAGDQVK